jgi:DNA-binding SARP family transcriptional activator
VVKDGEIVTVSARKVEIVLATLLIRANQVVSIEQLSTEIWGEHPPQRATAALYVYISQLRKLLSPATGGPGPIITRAPGYLLRFDRDELDLAVFESLVARGREFMREQRYEAARAEFERALAMWRGPVLSDLREGPIINGFAFWLEEIRLECNEMLVEAKLRLGRHRELVSVLRQLTAEHPLHEAFYRQLMLALDHSERRADALDVYAKARATLQRELGLEPGPHLRELWRSIQRSGEVHEYREAG